MNHRHPHHGLGVFCALTAFLALSGCAALQRTRSPLDRVVEAAGLERFDQVDALRYTFNVKIGDKVTQRGWLWEPRRDRVTFYGTPEQGGTVTYERAGLAAPGAEALRQVDAWFINDNYWLLFPLRVHWDKAVVVAEDRAPVELPLGGGRARRIVVSFPPTGGYTPGDIYEIFVDEASRIAQWVYRKGGDTKPTRVTTWEGYRRFGPFWLALDHQGPGAGFRVWFTDAGVRLAGESGWREGESR
jgi:hypothetical protein